MKYVKAINIILQSPGLVMVYSDYIEKEGLYTFRIYLDLFGFNEYGLAGNQTGKKKQYIFYSGKEDIQ